MRLELARYRGNRRLPNTGAPIEFSHAPNYIVSQCNLTGLASQYVYKGGVGDPSTSGADIAENEHFAIGHKAAAGARFRTSAPLLRCDII